MRRCAQSPRSNVLAKYACARRLFARRASKIFLSSLQTQSFINCYRIKFCSQPMKIYSLIVILALALPGAVSVQHQLSKTIVQIPNLMGAIHQFLFYGHLSLLRDVHRELGLK
jgi:hypothetical protein